MSEQSLKFRVAKDSASSQTASCVVDFYNCIGEDEDLKNDAFMTLTEALKKLTGSATQLQEVAVDYSGALPVATAPSIAEVVNEPKKEEVKKRASKDPFAPKKPLTVFFAYSAYIRDSLIEDRKKSNLPPYTSVEITQEISKRWKELSDEEKSKWKQAYMAELEHYQKRKAEYLEAKKNGTFQADVDFTNNAPVPIPNDIGVTSQAIEDAVIAELENVDSQDAGASAGSKRTRASEPEKKKKKKKSKKDKKNASNE
ncbi:hypothetical protein ACO0RG_002610 [Hanseniaspora osmophila]